MLTRREFVARSACSALALPSLYTEAKQRPGKYEIGAYYFPNFHADPRNEEVHGPEWDEWRLLKRAEPRFEGHAQPKKPAWGYEDESNPKVFEKKIQAATDAALTHFIFDWYWYQGRPFLNGALERGYLNAANVDRLKFSLMWANHNWLKSIPG